MMIQKNRHQEAIDYALNILGREPYKNYIEKIYLFGSCAREQEKYTSDVDLLLECSENMTAQIARSMRIAVMPEQLDMPEIDLKFEKGSKWKEQDDQFSKNLLKEGVLLWEKK